MITVVIAFVAALIAMLLTIWDCDFKCERYRPIKEARPLEEILVERSSYVSTYHLKERLLKEGVKEHRCECCGNTEWMGESIALELHHVNGVKDDLRIENLQILCPNCHAFTDNYRGRNISK